jgi:hypothetical protein
MMHRRRMDEQVAAWVRNSTSEQGKDEKLGNSDETVAELVTLMRARRRARTEDRNENRATRESRDDRASR